MNVQTITDVDRYEPGGSKSADSEAVLYLFEKAPYVNEGRKNLIGHLYIDTSLLPQEGTAVGTQYEMTLQLEDSAVAKARKRGDTSSKVPLRAAYEGANDGSPEFTLRDDSDGTDGARRGYLYLFPDLFDETVSLDFVDLTTDINVGSGTPNESYAVTFEFEMSPGILSEG